MARRAVSDDGTQLALPLAALAPSIDKGLLAAKALAGATKPEHRLAFARSFVFEAVAAIWERASPGWPLRELPQGARLRHLAKPASELARHLGLTAGGLELPQAAYVVGNLYTTLLPTNVRADFGAYYTPPALCEHLLDMASDAGVDWRTARVLDPACGGGAFLSPIAQRMRDSLVGCGARIAVKNIANRLRGFEIDPFAAWMSQAFLELTLGDLSLAAGVRLPVLVEICNSLHRAPSRRGFDLVVGNPPYGRIKLEPELREKYRRSLYGHANLYGLFTELALRFAGRGGVIAYVTPASFLAGEYYKALRSLLAREAPPASIGFVMERKGVFSDVLQETLLATYRCGGDHADGRVHFISPGARGGIRVTEAGSFRLPSEPEQPWLVPRSRADCALVRAASGMPHRLEHYGYKVSTGPLVWNRHKGSLRDRPANGRFPLIWAESVRPDGTFEFRAEKRNHKPYFEPSTNEMWVVTHSPCVLLQRTTAKEQSRRLIAAELPRAFIREHGAVVVENHLNMVRPISGEPSVSPAAVSALLNTKTVDRLFRCINGSVAVSASELQALPLPNPAEMDELESLVAKGAARRTIEGVVARMYVGGKSSFPC